MVLREVIGLALVLGGVSFSVVGIIGIVRMPDVYCRIHASGKVSTLGLLGLMTGCAILVPATGLKLLALAMFLMITTPVASHAIAAAAYRQGTPHVGAQRDELGGRTVNAPASDQT